MNREPNQAFKDRNRKDTDPTDTVDVRYVNDLSVNCARCGRIMQMNLRGLDTLYLPDIRCGSCRRK